MKLALLIFASLRLTTCIILNVAMLCFLKYFIIAFTFHVHIFNDLNILDTYSSLPYLVVIFPQRLYFLIDLYNLYTLYIFSFLNFNHVPDISCQSPWCCYNLQRHLEYYDSTDTGGVIT